jgi:hypothetical protein
MVSHDISKNKARTALSTGKVMGNAFKMLRDAYWLIFCQKGKPSTWLITFGHSKTAMCTYEKHPMKKKVGVQ